MRSHPKSTTTPAFSAAFLLQFLDAEAEFEALRQAGTALGNRASAPSGASQPNPPSPDLHSRLLTSLLATELGSLAQILHQRASPTQIFALIEEHRPAAYRLARIAELVPQLHSLAVLFANLESPYPPQLEEWEPTTMAPEAATTELRHRMLQLAGTLRLAIGGLRRLEQRLPIPRGTDLEPLLEDHQPSELIALSGAVECILVDHLAATVATLEATAAEDWDPHSDRQERILLECDPTWPAKEAQFSPPIERQRDPLQQLLSAARVAATQARLSAGYLNSLLAALPADTLNHPALTAQTHSALAALADAAAALEGVGE